MTGGSPAPGAKASARQRARARQASERADRWAHRRAEPRMLAFAWTVYLLGATGLTFARIGLVEPVDAQVYRAAARALLLTVAIGACALWPMVRLSQQIPRRPLLATFKDLLVIVAPMQAVIWGQALLSGWPLASIGAVSLALAAWTGIAGGALAITLAPGPGGVSAARRIGGMVAVLGVTAAGSIAALQLGIEGAAGLLTPYTVPFSLVGETLTAGFARGPGGGQWQAVVGLCLIAPAPWLVAAALGPHAHRGPRSLPLAETAPTR